MWNSRPPPLHGKTILNFHFDYLNPSLSQTCCFIFVLSSKYIAASLKLGSFPGHIVLSNFQLSLIIPLLIPASSEHYRERDGDGDGDGALIQIDHFYSDRPYKKEWQKPMLNSALDWLHINQDQMKSKLIYIVMWWNFTLLKWQWQWNMYLITCHNDNDNELAIIFVSCMMQFFLSWTIRNNHLQNEFQIFLHYIVISRSCQNNQMNKIYMS